MMEIGEHYCSPNRLLCRLGASQSNPSRTIVGWIGETPEGLQEVETRSAVDAVSQSAVASWQFFLESLSGRGGILPSACKTVAAENESCGQQEETRRRPTASHLT